MKESGISQDEINEVTMKTFSHPSMNTHDLLKNDKIQESKQINLSKDELNKF